MFLRRGSATPSDLIRFHRGVLKDNLVRRARLLALLRGWFAARGFLEVETPVVCSSPGVETHLAALETRVCGRRMYLTTSPEFHMKRLVAAGFDRVFQVTRAFRDGERGALHNPEFTMVEWYRAGAGYEAIMDDCESLLRDLAVGLLGQAEAPEVPAVRDAVSLAPPFPRRTFRQAFRDAGVEGALGLPLDDRTRVFVDRVEPSIGRRVAEFLTEYPADMASLARLKPSDPSVAERFELYAGGLEIANGFTEIRDADEFLARCEAHLAERRRRGLPEYPVDERYVTMLRNGLPPCAGVALGFDRVVMLLCGAATMEEVLAFCVDDA